MCSGGGTSNDDSATTQSASTPPQLSICNMTYSSSITTPHFRSARNNSIDFEESFKALVKQTMEKRCTVLNTSPHDVAISLHWRRDYGTATSQPIAIHFGHRRTLSFEEALAAQDMTPSPSTPSPRSVGACQLDDHDDDDIFVMEL
ncbi:hypothetical protein H310_00775 [Aphanomyces invadans]|uniref:Uncharacterized protein n=1 Tax=Aphanomyces invadans TaxID=157072 RepID=A0A024UVD8_9STRA|nr:hypothetical protein H310_00775 [Aphanomyces invadans]ETW10481.1 hypothetical protein H310_00775 [Aphanomyces invadans]|eukprot:XP_008861892.1 hypothetical protein H310_00775 [Aphanomyces invadans]